MKAAILFEQNKNLTVEEIEMPKKLDFGQVKVKLHFSGICGSQIGEIYGIKGPDRYLPHLLGHEGCGTVLEIGAGVSNVKEGDLVVLHWMRGNGLQSETPKYKLRDEIINAGWVTTFNSFAVVSENRCTKIPKKTDQKIAALLGCAITTGFGVVENNINLKMGESIVIFGAGGIGLNIIQAAKIRNAWPIIAVDIFDHRLDLALKMGATHTINTKKEDPLKIQNILEGSDLDIFVDNTGITDIIQFGYKITGPKGKIVLVGVPRKDQNILIHSLPLHFGKVLIGSHGGTCRPAEDIPRILKLLDKGKIDFSNLITDIYPLEKINDAINRMKRGETKGRILIKL